MDHKKCPNNHTSTLCSKPNPSLATSVPITQWARTLGKNLNVSMEIKALISPTGLTLAPMVSIRASYRTIKTTKRTSTHARAWVVVGAPRTLPRCRPFRNSIVASSSPRSSTITKIWYVSQTSTWTRKTWKWGRQVAMGITPHSMMASSFHCPCWARPPASSTLPTWTETPPRRTQRLWSTTSCLRGSTWHRLPPESSTGEIFQICKQTRSKISNNCSVITREYHNPVSSTAPLGTWTMPRWTRRTSASSSLRVICSTQWSLARSRATRLLTGTCPKTVTLGWLREVSKMGLNNQLESCPMVRFLPNRMCLRGSGNQGPTRTQAWMVGTQWFTSQTQATLSELTRGWSKPVTSRTPPSSWTSMQTSTKMRTSPTRHLEGLWTILWTKAVTI